MWQFLSGVQESSGLNPARSILLDTRYMNVKGIKTGTLITSSFKLNLHDKEMFLLMLLQKIDDNLFQLLIED